MPRDHETPEPPVVADKIAISLALDAALKAYRDAYGPDRYLARIEHALRFATPAAAAEEHGRQDAG